MASIQLLCPEGHLALPDQKEETVKSIISFTENVLPPGFSPWDVLLENTVITNAKKDNLRRINTFFSYL